MLSSRITWAVCIVASVLFLLFSQHVIALVVLLVVIAIPLLLILIHLLFSRRVLLELNVPALAEKEETLTCILRAENRGIVPLSPVVCTVSCRNVLTGEETSSRVLFSIGRKSEQKVEFTLESRHCGGLEIALKAARVFDTLGLSSTQISVDESAVSTILPHTFAPHITIVPNLSKDIEADEYSQTKAGPDPSEVFAIREYLPGDSLKQMHWKLTSKFDQFIVKETGLPVRHSFLVLLETSLDVDQSLNPVVADALSEIMVSLCQALAQAEIVFDVAWQDNSAQCFFKHCVSNMDELTGVIDRMLRAYAAPTGLNACANYTDALGASDYEHIVYISPFVPTEIETFAGEARATAVVCAGQSEGAVAVELGNTTVYYCTPDNYEEAFYVIEI